MTCFSRQDCISSFWEYLHFFPRCTISKVAQRKRAGPITQRSVDRNHPLLHTTLFLSYWHRTGYHRACHSMCLTFAEIGFSFFFFSIMKDIMKKSTKIFCNPIFFEQFSFWIGLKSHFAVTTDSSVGRAEDCRWYLAVTGILRSLVQIRLGGLLLSKSTQKFKNQTRIGYHKFYGLF